MTFRKAICLLVLSFFIGPLAAFGSSQSLLLVNNFLGIPLSTTAPTNGQCYVYSSGSNQWAPNSCGGGGGGSGTVTSVSGVNTNGFSFSIANPTTTPAITLSTSITGVLKGNGTAISAATPGTDYLTVLTGDVTTSGNAATLATVNSNIGTFVAETVNGKGLVTAAQNLSGDITTSGAVSTLATVNSNIGSFGSSTSIPSFTVNAKGLLTAASGNAVIAPAGTLTGATLASGVTASSLTSLGTQTQSLNLGSNKVVSVADPTSAQDAATKNYVDTQLAQLNPAAAVVAASTATIAGSYVNAIGGICIGDTFTTTATTSFVLDGVSPSIGARVLLKNQSSSFQNGVWNLTTQAVGGISGAVLTRALDSDSSSDLNAGQIVPVSGGTINAGSSWYQTSVVTTCSSDSQTWTQFQAASSAYLLKANNLSDVASAGTARNNLGLGTASAPTNGQILIGNGTNYSTAAITQGAGITVTNGSGTITIANNAMVIQTFTSSGTYTPTTGMLFAEVYCLGGGGGGGGGALQTAGAASGGGGGGGGGAQAYGVFSATQIGASQTVTIASTAAGGSGGGAGSATAGGQGTPGNTTTFGSLLSAFGGGAGGGGGLAAAEGGGGGAGGLSSGGNGTTAGGSAGTGGTAGVASGASAVDASAYGGAGGGGQTAACAISTSIGGSSTWGGPGGGAGGCITSANSPKSGASGGTGCVLSGIAQSTFGAGGATGVTGGSSGAISANAPAWCGGSAGGGGGATVAGTSGIGGSGGLGAGGGGGGSAQTAGGNARAGGPGGAGQCVIYEHL